MRLPPDLLQRAKRKAGAEGRTLTALIAEGLRIVTAQRRSGAPRRVIPRVSKARGGTLPGIDLADSAGLQEHDDLEAIGRLKEPR